MMRNKINFFILIVSSFLWNVSEIRGEGISVDAGLTPAQDRIVIRMQYRNIINKMGDDIRLMHMMPVVVAYGLSPDITLMMRNGYGAVGKNETMMQMEDNWMDPFFMGKVKLYRHNTRNYVIGVAGFAGSSFPLLSSSSSKTFSPQLGINASFRPKYWSFDLNNAYEWMDYNSEEKQAEAKQFQMNLAISRNFVLRKLNNLVLAPVQEFSFARNNPTTGDSQSFGFISPGLQLVSPHLKLECLYQIPINPSHATVKNGSRLIVGLRLML